MTEGLAGNIFLSPLVRPASVPHSVKSVDFARSVLRNIILLANRAIHSFDGAIKTLPAKLKKINGDISIYTKFTLDATWLIDRSYLNTKGNNDSENNLHGRYKREKIMVKRNFYATICIRTDTGCRNFAK